MTELAAIGARNFSDGDRGQANTETVDLHVFRDCWFKKGCGRKVAKDTGCQSCIRVVNLREDLHIA